MLSKQYKNRIAVNQVNAVLKKGVYGLPGANGAGKTTLLHMLACVLKPTSGQIFCNGQKDKDLFGRNDTPPWNRPGAFE